MRLFICIVSISLFFENQTLEDQIYKITYMHIYFHHSSKNSDYDP